MFPKEDPRNRPFARAYEFARKLVLLFVDGLFHFLLTYFRRQMERILRFGVLRVLVQVTRISVDRYAQNAPNWKRSY